MILKLWLCFILEVPLFVFGQAVDSAGVLNPSTSETKEKLLHKAIPYMPPVLFLGYGFMSLNNKVVRRIDHFVYDDMQEDYPGFSTSVDNYLQHSPAALVGVLTISGVKGQNNVFDQAALFAISTSIMSSSVTFIKRQTGKFRPNQTSYTSFPSGHTSTAFAAAEFLYQEYGGRSVWFGILGYSAATATGILRVYNNAHWFSDIIAGAGLGILSTKAAYFIYPKVKHLLNSSKYDFTVLPSYQKGYSGIAIHGNL